MMLTNIAVLILSILTVVLAIFAFRLFKEMGEYQELLRLEKVKTDIFSKKPYEAVWKNIRYRNLDDPELSNMNTDLPKVLFVIWDTYEKPECPRVMLYSRFEDVKTDMVGYSRSRKFMGVIDRIHLKTLGASEKGTYGITWEITPEW